MPAPSAGISAEISGMASSYFEALLPDTVVRILKYAEESSSPGVCTAGCTKAAPAPLRKIGRLPLRSWLHSWLRSSLQSWLHSFTP